MVSMLEVLLLPLTSLQQHVRHTGPAAAPSTPGTTIVLSQYVLTYEVPLTSFPLPSDFDELTMVTSSHNNDFFTEAFATSSVILFDSSSTEFADNAFGIDNVEVSYETSLTFFPASAIPTVEDVEFALGFAYQGEQLDDYLALLQSLPAANVFQGTTAVSFRIGEITLSTAEAPPSPTVTTQSEETEADGDSGIEAGAIAAAAGAGAFVLLLAGLYASRRRNNHRGHLGKFPDHDGHMTVAGETFTGQSTDTHWDGSHGVQDENSVVNSEAGYSRDTNGGRALSPTVEADEIEEEDEGRSFGRNSPHMDDAVF